MKTAVLLSGGQDSAALTAMIRPELAITVNYGQVPAEGEITAATEIARALGVSHIVVEADCSRIGSGDLAGVPASPVAPTSEWWPYRNQLLITIAATVAVSQGVEMLAVASVASDGSHADGRSEFFAAVNKLMRLQEGDLQVCAPAIALRSPELIRQSGIQPEVLAWAHSCHTANVACGACRGCTKHREVLDELGITAY